MCCRKKGKPKIGSHSAGEDKGIKYLVRGSICRKMICIFIFSLLAIAIVSIGFFYWFLDHVMEMAIENVYIANTMNLINDII